MESAALTPPPPLPPERPEGVSPFPRWPPWLGLVAFVTSLTIPLVFGLVFGFAAAIAGMEIGNGFEGEPLVIAVGAFVQDLAFVAVAIGFAWIVTRPRPWHFGLRPARFWPALGWSTLGLVVSYGFSVFYTAGLGVDQEQTTLEDLGADESYTMLVVTALLVIVIAPVVEEFFFRGFLYRSFRTSLGVWPAALLAGGIFGVIHALTGIAAVPILIVLGVVLCLVYERSGTLYAPIAMHAFNNTLAFSTETGDAALGLGLGALTIGSCIVLPWLSRRRGAALPATA
jgi:uncharacterized protein